LAASLSSETNPAKRFRYDEASTRPSERNSAWLEAFEFTTGGGD
jgi:hypothetical protein